LGVASAPLQPDVCGRGRDGEGLLRAAKLTVPQAAKMMGIGETKMREIVARGEIPVIRIMGKVLILERDLEGFLMGSYGALGKAKTPPKGLPSLPRRVQESELLRKTG